MTEYLDREMDDFFGSKFLQISNMTDRLNLIICEIEEMGLQPLINSFCMAINIADDRVRQAIKLESFDDHIELRIYSIDIDFKQIWMECLSSYPADSLEKAS